ncbi:MAG: hypothetical protein WAL75_22585 [Terracidiphilus sp.]
MRIRGTALLFATIPILFAGGGHAMPQETECAHASTSFNFDVHASFARTALLFGPISEKGWAGERWQPRFSYPQPGKDIPGAVFTVQHGPHTGIWVNTIYDVTGGRMQYVAIIPGVVATTVDVRLTSEGTNQTGGNVSYVRTALDAAANDDVRGMADHDAVIGPEWEQAIAEVLSNQTARPMRRPALARVLSLKLIA